MPLITPALALGIRVCHRVEKNITRWTKTFNTCIVASPSLCHCIACRSIVIQKRYTSDLIPFESFFFRASSRIYTPFSPLIFSLENGFLSFCLAIMQPPRSRRIPLLCEHLEFLKRRRILSGEHLIITGAGFTLLTRRSQQLANSDR